jgi:hypothetical protein
MANALLGPSSILGGGLPESTDPNADIARRMFEQRQREREQQSQQQQTPSQQDIMDQFAGPEMTSPVQSFGGGSAAVSGGSFTPLSGNFSPAATSDPFTSGGLQQTPGADFFSAPSSGVGAPTGGGGGGTTGGSGIGAAGPWAALAIAVGAKANSDVKSGTIESFDKFFTNPPESIRKVMDADKARVDKLGIEGLGGAATMPNRLAGGDVSGFGRDIEDQLTAPFSQLKGLF